MPEDLPPKRHFPTYDDRDKDDATSDFDQPSSTEGPERSTPTKRPPKTSITPKEMLTAGQKRFLKVLGAIIGLIVVAVIVTLVMFPPQTTVNTRDPVPIPSISQAQPKPNDLQKVRAAYGPWQLVGNNDTASKNVVMLTQNGTKEVGSKTLSVKDWEPAVANGISDTQIGADGKTVLVRTNAQVIYTLNLNQPFIMENVPATVYAITPNGIVSHPFGK